MPPNIGDLVLGLKFSDPIITYTKERLQTDLAAGVGTVLAGVGSDYRLEADATNGWVLLKHKDVAYGHTGGGAGYTGAVRTAVGITANGFMAGYNDKTTGDWVNSIAIDATTGAASFAGAINATSGNFTGTVNVGSVIAGAVTVNGTSLLTIKDNAALGATAVQPAAIANMLTASSSYVLSGVISMPSVSSNGIKTGTITWDSSGLVNGGSGIAITNKGIVGASAGVVTFSINGTTGSAIFKGDITGATGTFGGNISTVSGSVTAQGMSSSTGVSGCIVGYNNANDGSGVFGWVGASATNVSERAGVTGLSDKTNCGGVQGTGPRFGVKGTSTDVAYAGVHAKHSSTGYALYCEGKMRISDSTLVSGLNADLLDGNHASAFLLTTGTAADSSKLGSYTAAYYARYVGIATGSPGTAFTHSITVSINGKNVRIPIFYP